MIERLGKYRIVGTIGQGGMGTVYRAHDPVLDRQVALKVVTADGELSAEQKARLLREGKACAQLTHPNVISIYDLGEDAGHIFIVMELLHGQDLKQLIAAHATVSVVEKLALMIQVCDGLHYAHQQGIVHRDIKPANIFVLPNGGLKILDFGLAHLTTSDSLLTQTGQILGTLPYMAPERFRGLSDHRGDIFAVGAVCYELLTGRRAFVAETAVQLIELIRTAHPPPLASMDASLPPELAVAVERALRKEPSARFADLGGMRTALDQVRQRLLNPGDARRLVPTMPLPADVTPPVTSDVPDAVAADQPPALPSRPRTATLVGRFAAHFRRFRLAISVSFTVSLAVAVYFVNLPHYADIDDLRVQRLPPATVSEPVPPRPARTSAPQSVPQREADRAATLVMAARDEASKAGAEGLAPTRFNVAGEKERAGSAALKRDDTVTAEQRYQEALAEYRLAKTEALSAAEKGADARKAERRAADARQTAERVSAPKLAPTPWSKGTMAQGRADEALKLQAFPRANALFAEAQQAYEEATRQVVSTMTVAAQKQEANKQEAQRQETLRQEAQRQAAVEQAPSDREAGVRSAVASYKRAIESKDLALLQKVRPGLSEADLETFRKSFARLESRKTEMAIDYIWVQGDLAEVKTREKDAHVADGASGTPSGETAHVFRLRRAPTGDWVIVAVQ